jgi:putative glutamine amidotransferase
VASVESRQAKGYDSKAAGIHNKPYVRSGQGLRGIRCLPLGSSSRQVVNKRDLLEMKRSRPCIGITTRIELETGRFYLSGAYSEAVEAAGGIPFLVPLIPHQEYIAAVMDQLDGVLLPGSDSDVDPLLYGREPYKQLGSVHPAKDATDLLVLGHVEERNLPLLAICFGMQVLNVSRGGTLIQDIASELPTAIKHDQGLPRARHSHSVRMLAGSRLAELAHSEGALVNSHHHQAVETVGKDLLATAWTSDGLVEALEDPRKERFVLAVQWHPEIAWESDDFARAIFGTFVSAAGGRNEM